MSLAKTWRPQNINTNFNSTGFEKNASSDKESKNSALLHKTHKNADEKKPCNRKRVQGFSLSPISAR